MMDRLGFNCAERKQFDDLSDCLYVGWSEEIGLRPNAVQIIALVSCVAVSVVTNARF
jgi:hypothetical protein